MEHIRLTHNRGFHWVTEGHTSFTGYVYDQNGRYLDAANAVSLFREVTDLPRLKRMLQHIDGAFSLIIRLPEGCLIATDTMGMFPLLYAISGKTWNISDDASYLSGLVNSSTFNENALPEFLSAGFVLGAETLVEGIYRTRPAEILFLRKDGTKEHESYYWFLPEAFTAAQLPQLKTTLRNTLQAVSDRLINSLNGRTAIVPLSGGYDSRLIACMLKAAGYSNTVCFTYGRPNPESVLSERVARALGFPWIFADYRNISTKEFLDTSNFNAYCNYAGSLASMPYLQEYFAVMHLKNDHNIPDDSIFLPGHTGDYLAGSYLEKTIRIRSDKRKDHRALANNYFTFVSLSQKNKRQIASRIKQWFEQYDHPEIASDPNYDAFTEDWDLKEKISKFIFNSSRVFPFFGYEYRFPLWDAELRAFFRNLPYTFRVFKQLYNEVIEEEYFKPLGVHFPAEELRETPKQLRWQAIKKRFRDFRPSFLRDRCLSKNDYLCYRRFTTEMTARLRKEGVPVNRNINSYNAFICQWYSNEVRKMTGNADTNLGSSR
ncbi:MAG: asparagine synthase C-terminal domain-containing protein [Bacteroidales bacterium]|nr:asparagine synthase C-terminal domain-containing protein [Bacteroidales bacterium]